MRDRIRALHAEHARDHSSDADTLIGKLENVYRRAIQDHHFHTAARCVELQARLKAMKGRQAPLPGLPELPQSPIKAPIKTPLRKKEDLREITKDVAAIEAEIGPMATR